MKLATLLLTALAAVMVSGCEKLGSSGEQITPTRDDKTFTMTVETIPSAQITDHCSRLGVKYDANGCASFNLDTKHCTIYVVAPQHADDVSRFAVVGHETWHCRFGEWHD